VDGGPEVGGVGAAGLGFGEVEGAGSGCVCRRSGGGRGGRWGGGTRGHGDVFCIRGRACGAGGLVAAARGKARPGVKVLVVEKGAVLDGLIGGVVAEGVFVGWVVLVGGESGPAVFGFGGDGVEGSVHVPRDGVEDVIVHVDARGFRAAEFHAGELFGARRTVGFAGVAVNGDILA